MRYDVGRGRWAPRAINAVSPLIADYLPDGMAPDVARYAIHAVADVLEELGLVVVERDKPQPGRPLALAEVLAQGEDFS